MHVLPLFEFAAHGFFLIVGDALARRAFLAISIHGAAVPGIMLRHTLVGRVFECDRVSRSIRNIGIRLDVVRFLPALIGVIALIGRLRLRRCIGAARLGSACAAQPRRH